MIKVGIVGITGFTGVELINILLNHRYVKINYVASRSQVGKKVSDIYPQLSGIFERTIEKIDVEKINEQDVVFLALPHTVSLSLAKQLSKDVKIIDLSADFRIKNVDLYEKWYKTKHEAKDLLKQSVYGLVELHRDDIRTAHIIANPGCYATSIILAAAPAFKYATDMIADAKSGVSGAGRGAKEGLQFCEVNENFKAYAIEGHRHMAEIEQELSYFKKNVSITFVPHLLPIQRGILSTVYMSVTEKIDFWNLYEEFYDNSVFVRVCKKLPSLNNVRGTNFCDLYPYFDESSKRLIIVSVIDNLVKGASGQAVQNMNVMFNLDEKEGLVLKPYYP